MGISRNRHEHVMNNRHNDSRQIVNLATPDCERLTYLLPAHLRTFLECHWCAGIFF